MPQPTQHQAHVDAVLTNISLAYVQSTTDFIADQFAPSIPVGKQSDRYYVYDKEDFMNDDAVTKRADAQESTGGGMKLSTDTYFAEVWATHKDLGPQFLANYDKPLQPRREATLLVSRKQLIRRERIWHDTYFHAGAWDTSWQGVDSAPGTGEFRQFDDYANSDPRGVISQAKLEIKRNTGFTPNTLVLSEEGYEKMKLHPDFEELFKGSDNAIVNRQRLAAALEIDRILVGGAVRRTSAALGPEASSVAQFDFIMGKHALLAYIATTPGLMIPSAAYRFTWNGLLGSNADGGRIVEISMPHLGLGTVRIESESAFDMKVTGKDLGLFLKDIIS